MSEHLTKDAFAGQVNTKFDIYFTPEKPTGTELIEVTELKATSRSESFSLLFLAPSDVPPEQRIYQVEHSALGSFEIFLVPIEKTDEGMLFETIFNRMIKKK